MPCLFGSICYSKWTNRTFPFIIFIYICSIGNHGLMKTKPFNLNFDLQKSYSVIGLSLGMGSLTTIWMINNEDVMRWARKWMTKMKKFPRMTKCGPSHQSSAIQRNITTVLINKSWFNFRILLFFSCHMIPWMRFNTCHAIRQQHRFTFSTCSIFHVNLVNLVQA